MKKPNSSHTYVGTGIVIILRDGTYAVATCAHNVVDYDKLKK